MGFSEYFETVQPCLTAWSSMAKALRPLEAILETAERGQGLEAEDAASLFAWGSSASRVAEIHSAAVRVRERCAPKDVEFIIPVYLTSFCQNECLYCGYRESNPLAERVRLSLEEFEAELDLILSWGYRQIELVLSDDMEFGPEKVAAYVGLTRRKLEARGGGVVALCSPAYEQEAYARLAAAGLDWMVEWQETYDEAHFNRWHFIGSPKRQFEFRLNIWDRAVAAGIRKVALGALLGLYHLRFDALCVIEHGNFLRRTYGMEPHALGIPRLKPARGVLASQKSSRFTVSDDDFRLIVSVYHLAFPRSRLFFNTRESYELNQSLVAAGDLFTVDCETLPGGYLRRRQPGQFFTHDYPPRREARAALEQRGYACRYLAEETLPPESLALALSTNEVDPKKWDAEHAEIRIQLDNWQLMQSRLAKQRGNGSTVCQDSIAALRPILQYFKTSVISHCHREEADLFPKLARETQNGAQLEALRRDHERLGVDLDKFERQLISYGLSGDPSALVTLGDRIIRELREHLDSEDALWASRSVR